MKKKWRGADLMRSDSKKASSPEPQPKPAEPKSKLGRIGVRKVMRGPDGEIIELNPTQIIWLVQMDGINEILLTDSLKSQGLTVKTCDQLHHLPQTLEETESFPSLIVLEARAVGQQTPFFRKTIVPLLDDIGIPCLVVGVANEKQAALFRAWYQGPMVVGGELETFLETIKKFVS